MYRWLVCLITTSLLFGCGNAVKPDASSVAPAQQSIPGMSDSLSDDPIEYADSYASKDEVKVFMAYMVDKHHYDALLLEAAFASIAPREKVIQKSDNQPEVMIPYYEYKTRFVASSRIEGGRQFMQQHRAWLLKAEREFGVPAAIIVSIIGVETLYGRVTGERDVFTSLATLAFDYPRRQDYFQRELEAYLLLAREQGWLLGNTKASYSGALGMVQFMPSNYRRLALDYDGDGVVDLWNSPADAIGSVANYLSSKKWQPQQPIIVKADMASQQVDNDAFQAWVNKGRQTYKTPSEWRVYGLTAPAQALQASTGVIALRESADTVGYWLAYDHFFAVMSYNPSRRYTMAVIELAEAIIKE